MAVTVAVTMAATRHAAEDLVSACARNVPRSLGAVPSSEDRRQCRIPGHPVAGLEGAKKQGVVPGVEERFRQRPGTPDGGMPGLPILWDSSK